MLTVTEAAERLRVGPEHIRVLIRTGKLAAAKAGDGRTSPYRINEEDLDGYIESRKVVAAEVAS